VKAQRRAVLIDDRRVGDRQRHGVGLVRERGRREEQREQDGHSRTSHCPDDVSAVRIVNRDS
jgi:hypothetical protein